MSSSHDAGYYAEKARVEMAKPCSKSKDGQHDWIKKGMYPSSWYECSHCHDTQYTK